MEETVLIIDDSLTVRMDLAEAFEAAGFRIALCATAREAREHLARTRTGLVILDVLLPDADGFDLLAEIRNAPLAAQAPVLMLSTEAEVKNRIRGLQTGADEYVGKPYDTSYVLARARELVRGRKDVEPDPPGERSAILVIDDSLTFREALRTALDAAGYKTLVAETGEDGLRMAANHRPAAVIIDGVLPGIDGATVIRRMRLDAVLRGTPCMLLTSSQDRQAELRALDAGADAFARKEEDLKVVVLRLANLLRSPGAGSENIHTASLLGPKKILAVDDSATYLEALSEALTSEGYDVVLARSGPEALEMLAVQPVDCILLDLLMPELSGTETCTRIKESPIVRDTPLIMLTALEGPEAMVEGLRAGADDYISKSSDFEVLKARVRAQIRRKQFEDENRGMRETLLRKEFEATEARAAQKLAETRALLVHELERKNQELEAFSYSVSHDLRAPLRSIDGFSKLVLEEHAQALDETGKNHLHRVRAAAQRMGELIDDLLQLSRVSRAGLVRRRVNLSEIATAVADELARREPERTVAVSIEQGLEAEADHRLMRVVFDNLLGNAWKFSAKTGDARVEVGVERRRDENVYFVRDNGAGFNMKYAQKLFRPFQRLHAERDFAGTGIGLATVHRIIDRHGGRIFAESAPNEGARFYFTLPRNKLDMEASHEP
jgi:two-component system NtrC family sensor kinase